MPTPAVVPPPPGLARRSAGGIKSARLVAPGAAGLPDVAVSTAPRSLRKLDRVGMAGVQAVAAVTVDGRDALLPAACDLTVSLDDEHARGIHMSRLYLRAQKFLEAGFTPARAADLLREMVGSHAGISEGAFLDVALTLPVRQPALVSGESGWRHYPVRAGGSVTGGTVTLSAAVRVEYSSTCPCSAALSRDLTAGKFDEAFGDADTLDPEEVREWLLREGSIAGHPHSQRSTADVAVTLRGDAGSPAAFPWQDLIETAEDALKTATQGAVKRADEREFARLNAENPMFCEDAARRLAAAVPTVPGVATYDIRVAHLESLHPHDAVARVSGTVEG